MSIRQHLLLYAMGIVLPMLAFAIFVAALLVHRDEDAIRRGAQDRLRALVTAVDAEVHGHITTMQALAASRELDKGDLRGFREEEERVLGSQSAWLNVTLVRPDGRQVVNASAPFGERLPPVNDLALVRHAASSREAVIGGLVVGAVDQRLGVGLALPVVRGDEVPYVIAVLLRPESFRGVIQQQKLPEGWVSGLVDEGGRFIARVPERPPGDPASSDFRAAVKRAAAGWYRGRTVEGRDTFTAHETSSYTGWSMGLALPASIVDSAASGTRWLMAGGMAACIAVALLVALWLGRRISLPVASIAERARRVGHEGGALPLKGVEEVDARRDVALALEEAAAAVEERRQALEREKHALEQADRAKDEFIATVSHELRNPLAALSAASHVVERAPAQHEAAAHARTVIARQTRHMARLVEDLLDVSRVLTGKANLQRETFDLADAAATLVATWRAAGRFREHPVSVSAESAWVDADRTRVEQILSNLLDNALKFSPAGQPVEVAVGIEAGREGEQAFLRVADRGTGLSREMLERAFDLFVQGEQGLERKAGGMGIGLALVKRLAELQGGSVTAKSEGLGRGAVFTVRFPAVPPRAAQAPARARSPGEARRVLLVEDNEDIRRTLADLIAMLGHEVIQAADGETALSAAMHASPDIAFVDIGLPGMDGYEVARRLRAAPLERRPSLVAMTGYGQQSDRARSSAAGFDRHITKPVPPESLEALIASL